MLEEHVAYYLEKYLGNYVKGLSKEALKISVWQGNVELTNMQLKPEALNALKLPIKVKAGFLGSVKLKVPWSRLGQEPVIVELDRIFVLAEPATDVEGGDADAVQDAKNARVKEDETKFVTAKQEESRKQELNNSSWLGSLISTIIGNLKLSITNIHIRYEDTESNPGHPFAVGMTLAKLAAVTVDDDGKETFVTGGSLDRIQKSGELNRLSFYFDTDSEPWPTDKPWEQFLPPEWSKIFEPGIKDYQSDDIVKEGETPSWIQRRHNYLLEPVAGTAQYFKLGNEDSRSPDRPAQKAVVILDDVTISLSERQYRDVLKLTENISTFSKRVQYAHYRPNVGVKEDARAWWQYSITAIMELQKKASGQMSWKQMLRLSHMRKQYVSKYVAALQANPDKITIDNNKEIQNLDRELDAGIILQWRMLAHTYVDQTRAEDAKRQQEEQAKGSWWLFGWGAQATNADSEGRPFTDEDWEQVNKIIGYQEGKPSMVVPGEDPPNMLHTVVEVRMNHNATKLLSANSTNILELSSEDLNCGIKLYPVAKSFDVKLASYKISCPEGLLGESATHEKAVNATFVLKPLEGNLDWKLAAKAAPCYVTVLKPAIDRVVAFFSSKEAVSQSVALETAAALQMTLDEVSKNAQQQLNQALKDKPKFSLDLDIAAPKITIPTDFFPDGKNQCKLLVDLGYLTLQTEEEGAADATQEELDLYMRFRIWLSDVSAFLVDGDFSWHKNYNMDATAGKLRLTDKESREEGTWNGSGGLKSVAGEISVNGVNGGDVKIENGAGAIKIYEKSESGKCNSDVGFNFWPVLEKTGMAVALQQICVPHSLYASTRVAVRVPSLGFQFSPARFHRLMQVLKVFQSSPDDAEDSSIRPWDPADFEGQMSVLSWKGVGHREAVWQHRYGALAGPFLYLLESSSSQSYKYCASLIGKQVFNVPPESVGDVQNVLAVCDAGQFNNKVAESVGALLLRFEDEASLYAWQGRLSRAIYGASAPGLVTMMGSSNKNDNPTQVLQNSEGNEKMTLAAHETFYFVGALDELKIVISNSAEVDHTSRKFLLEPEKPLLEFRAIGSKVEFLMKQFDMQVGAVLESLVVEDKYHGHVSSSCRYLARSYIKESKKAHKNKKGGTKVSQSRNSDNPEQQQQPKSKSLTETTRAGGNSSSQPAVAHKGRSSDDRFFDATEDLAESDDGSRSPLRRRSFNRAAVIFYDAEEGSEDMEREPPSFKREVGLLPGTTAASSSPADELLRSKSLQTFVKAQVIISSQESPEYANIDKEVRVGLSTLSFYCNRPTLIALMDLGTAITADVEEQPPPEESTQPAAGPTSTAGGGYSTDLVSTIDTSVIEDVDEDGNPKVPYERKDSVVKGLLGQGKDRVMFLLVVNMDLAQIVLNSDDGSQLATLSQENLHTEVKLYPASWGIKAALGNLRISDDGVDDAHQPYQYICDMRDPQGTSFIELEIVSFNADDEDYEGYEFSITGKMSELRIVFLNRFIQEVLAYGMGLIPPSSGEVLVKLKDRVTDVEKLFTQSEIEGQPSLKIDLSLMKPIIIMPRSSHSTDFLELDILHINIRSTSEWYGGSKDELGAVRLETMTLEIEDLHLVVGVGGQTGEGIIQEANGFSLVLRRPLRDLWHQVPAADLSVKIEELKAALSDKEYQVITECAISNMAETPNLPPSLFPSKEEATDKINKEKQIVLEESPPPRRLSSDSNVVTNEAHGCSTEETVPEISGSSANTAASLASENAHTTVKIGIVIDLVQLSLFVGGSRDNTLASIQVSGVWASLKQNSVEEMMVMATLERFSVKDDREGTDPEMCYMIGSADDRESNNLLGVAAATTIINNPQNEILENNNKSGTVMDTPSCSKPGCRSALTMLVMDAKISPTLQLISVRMQRPRLLVAFDFLLAVAEFFIPSVHAILSEGKGDENPLDMTGGIFLSEPAHKQAHKDVEISPSKPLVADCDTVNEYVYDGQGNHLRLLNRNGTDLSEFSPEALIFIGDGKRLIFRNIIIQNGDFLDSCISLGSNSSYSASEDDGVFFEGPPEGSMDESTKHSTSTNKGQEAEAEDKPPTELLFDLQAIGPELTFYDSLRRPAEPLLVPERLVRARMNAFSRLCLRGEDLELNANLNAFTMESSSGVSVVEPFDATVKYSKVSGKQNIHVSMSEIYSNFSFSILQLILRLQDDVMAFMRITSEQITVECSEFDRIWVDDRPEEKSGGRNIAFWRPRPPPGFAVLGDCFTPRNEIPSKGVLALNMGLARVKRPVDFKLVWSSFDLSSSLHRGMNANGSANSLYGVVMAEEGLSGSNRADGKSFLDEDGEDQEQECSVWLPIPSPGYVALGCVASRGHEPPSPTTALCVLATLVTPCSMKDCIYVSTQNLNETFEHQKQWAFWRVDNSIGSFFTQSGLDTAIKYKAYEIRHVINNYKPYIVHETEPATAVSRQLSGTTPDLDVLQQEGTPSQDIQRDESGVVVSQGLSSGRSYEKVARFKLIWWDKGSGSRDGVSIWRPIVPPGCAMLGDLAVQGYEPPSIGLVLNDTLEGGLLAKPLRFQERGQISKRRGMEGVSFWYPVAPPGYVAMGCIASKSSVPEPDGVNHVCCVRNVLVTRVNFTAHSIWDSSTLRHGNEELSIWPVENEANTFFARPGRKRPPKRLALDLADFRKVTRPDNLTVDAEIKRISATFFDDFGGLMAPLVEFSVSGIQASVHGRMEALSSTTNFTLSATTYNGKYDAWEPLIEPCDTFVRFEYKSHPTDKVLPTESQIRVNTSSDLNVNVSTANMNLFLEAYASWTNLSRIEEGSKQQLIQDQRPSQRALNRKPSRLSIAKSLSGAPHNGNKGFNIVNHNELGEQLFLRVIEANGRPKIVPLPPGGTASVKLPTSRSMQDPGTKESLRRSPVKYIALRIGSAELPEEEGLGGREFMAAVRVVPSAPTSDNRELLYQSARTRCVNPDKDNRGGRIYVHWDEIFVFEVQPGDMNKAEIVVTDLAQGAAVGFCSIPLSENSGKNKFAPHYNVQSEGPVPRSSLELTPVKLLAPRGQRSTENNSEEKKQQIDCGEINLAQYFFSVSADQDMSADGLLGGEDSGSHKPGMIEVSPSERGPWTQVGLNYALGPAPWYMGNTTLASEIVVVEGVKHLIVRTLVQLSNDTDFFLDVRLCPDFLLEGGSGLDPIEVDVDETGAFVEEEVFEDERYQPLAGWGSAWPGHLLPTDPGHWSKRDLSAASPPISEVDPPLAWEWTSEWHVDKVGPVDQDGWAYGFDFWSLKTWPPAQGSENAMSFIRRRRWVRSRQRIGKEKSKCILLGILEPGTTIPFPLKSLCAGSLDYCVQVRPHLGGMSPSLTHNWSQVAPSKARTEMSLRRSATKLFRVRSLTETEELLLCPAEAGSSNTTPGKDIWFCLESKATEIGKNARLEPIQDWCLKISAPLMLENLLPVPCEYMVSEKSTGRGPIVRDRGIANPGEITFAFHADLRKALYLTWIPQGNWHPKKDAVLISHPYRELANHITVDNAVTGRRLKIQVQQSNEEKSNATKVIQLYVPYWLDTKKCPPLKYKLVAIGQHADKKGEYTGDLGLRKLKALSADAAADLDQMENSPTMLSSFDCRSLELSVALANSAEAVFGPGTPLQALDEADGSVELHAIDDEGSYFRFLVTTTSSPFHSGQTKVVRIRPYMTFTNRLGQELILRQNSVNQARTLKASDSRVSFPFQETENPIMLQIQLAGSQWSHPFAIQKEESLHLMIRHDNGLRQSVQVDVRGYEDGSRFLVFFRLGSSRGPYRIENRTKFRRIKFRQAGLDEEAWQTLRPHSTTSFAWEHPQGLQLLEVVADGMEASDALKYDINKIGNQPVLTFDGVTSSSVCVHVLELGEIKAVRFFDQELEVVDAGSSSNKEGKEILLAQEGSAEPVQEDEVKRDVPSQLEIVFGIEKFGLSVIDHKPQEILFLSLQKVGITYSAGLGQENISRLKVMVRYIQLDNQLPLAAMPVLLAPETGDENEESVVKATINVYNDNSNVIAVYPYIGIRVTQSAWQINVHEPIIWAVMEMVNNLHLDRLSSDSDVVQVDPEIRIELIDVSEVRLKLTLETAPEQRPRGTLGIWSPVVTTIGNISKMPIHFSSVFHEYRYMRKSQVMPAILNRVRRDLIHQPLQLLIGVNVLGMTSSTLGTLSRGAAELSGDGKFLRLRSKQERSRIIGGVSDGLLQGTEALARGFAYGFRGVVTKPVYSARQNGVAGFFSGLGKAAVGVVVQPVSGALDFVALTVNGVGTSCTNCFDIFEHKPKFGPARLPRAICGDGILRPYDEQTAYGQAILRLAQSGAYFGSKDVFKEPAKFAWSDFYQDHFPLPKNKILMLTNRRIMMLVRTASHEKGSDLTLSDPCTILWEVQWGNILAMEVATGPSDELPCHVLIHLRYSTKSFAHVIHCYRPDENRYPQASYIYQVVYHQWRALGAGHNLPPSKRGRRQQHRRMTPKLGPIVDANPRKKLEQQDSTSLCWSEDVGESSASAASSPALAYECSEGFKKEVVLFEQVWTTDREPSRQCSFCCMGSAGNEKCTIWRPIALEGYVSVGDVAYVGKHPPTIVMTYKNGKGRFAQPTGFDLVWRNWKDGVNDPISIWMPRAPEGYVALGCVAVPDYKEPENDSVWCVHSDLTEEAELEEYPVYHAPSDSPWHCFLYPVNSDSLTFMAMREQKHSGSPVPHRIISGILHEIQS